MAWQDLQQWLRPIRGSHGYPKWQRRCLVVAHPSRPVFGWKSVKSVNLWSDKDHNAESNHYTFQLEDRTDSPDASKQLVRSEKPDIEFDAQANLKRQSQGNESRIAYNTGSANYADLYASDHNYNYDEAQNIGAYLLNLTKSPAEQSCVQQSQWQFSDLPANGWTASTTELNDTAPLDTLQTIFSDAKNCRPQKDPPCRRPVS